jgi:hypothetical protein
VPSVAAGGDVAMLLQRTGERTRWLSTRIGSCSPFRWISGTV